MKLFCEVCCPTLDAVARAAAAGADRIELCERLEVGGVTPAEELIREALAVAGGSAEAGPQSVYGNVPANDSSPVPVNVLIRPREGNFVYNEEEAAQMLASIALCKRLGVNGVVIGALRPDGSVDMPLMQRLVDAAKCDAWRVGPAEVNCELGSLLRPLSITFHRAFDECSDVFAALEDIISLGIDRLLTSGHCADAWEGRFALRDLVARAAGRIVIMPGCGITPANLPEIAATTRATEFHGSRILR